MTRKSLKLIAPNNLPVLGVLLADGSLCEMAVSYDPSTKVSDLQLIGPEGELAQKNGQKILVDPEGNHWAYDEVLFHTIWHT